MNRIILLLFLMLLIGSTNAQNQSNTGLRQPVFITSEEPIVSKSIMQEIFLIEDEKFRIEKNQNLSKEEKATQLNEVNKNFIEKRNQFINYVNSKGFSSVEEKEQLYYVSLLKEDGKMEEYKKYIDLLKKDK